MKQKIKWTNHGVRVTAFGGGQDNIAFYDRANQATGNAKGETSWTIASLSIISFPFQSYILYALSPLAPSYLHTLLCAQALTILEGATNGLCRRILYLDTYNWCTCASAPVLGGRPHILKHIPLSINYRTEIRFNSGYIKQRSNSLFATSALQIVSADLNLL